MPLALVESNVQMYMRLTPWGQEEVDCHQTLVAGASVMFELNRLTLIVGTTAVAGLYILALVEYSCGQSCNLALAIAHTGA